LRKIILTTFQFFHVFTQPRSSVNIAMSALPATNKRIANFDRGQIPSCFVTTSIAGASPSGFPTPNIDRIAREG
jgi:hypothetical protein